MDAQMKMHRQMDVINNNNNYNVHDNECTCNAHVTTENFTVKDKVNLNGNNELRNNNKIQ